MDLLLLIGSFFVFLFLGIPIAYALCVSSIIYMLAYSDVPLIIIAQQMLKGVDSFTLMAIPFFVIAGSLMQNGIAINVKESTPFNICCAIIINGTSE